MCNLVFPFYNWLATCASADVSNLVQYTICPVRRLMFALNTVIRMCPEIIKPFNCRGNPWNDGPRHQPPVFSVSPSPEQGVYAQPHMAHALTTLIVSPP